MRVPAALLTLALVLSPVASEASARKVTGPTGQTLSVDRTTNLAAKHTVTVTGKGYNTKLGIYVAFCEVPKRGQLPSNCLGGTNLNGKSTSSYWISSNPPGYGKNLATAFGKGGSFSVRLKVARYIGKTDCAIKKCAILTRADHTKSANRKADVAIPVSFRK